MEWYSKLEGLNPREGKRLEGLARQAGPGPIVEIGSWKGKSTIYLAKGSLRGKKVTVYAIDPHTGSAEHKKQYGKVWTFTEFKNNISRAKVGSVVKPVLLFSTEATKKIKANPSLVFIDGAHDYKSVKQDFNAWFPRLVDGGYIAFHDTILWDGPRDLTKEKIIGSRNFRNVGFVDSLLWAQKVKSNTALDRLRNRLVLLTKDLYEMSYKAYSLVRYGK